MPKSIALRAHAYLKVTIEMYQKHRWFSCYPSNMSIVYGERILVSVYWASGGVYIAAAFMNPTQ